MPDLNDNKNKSRNIRQEELIEKILAQQTHLLAAKFVLLSRNRLG